LEIFLTIHAFGEEGFLHKVSLDEKTLFILDFGSTPWKVPTFWFKETQLCEEKRRKAFLS
jgi:hypothetical protein